MTWFLFNYLPGMGRESMSSNPDKGDTVQGTVHEAVEKPFRFMDLPPEVRIMIYRLVVRKRWSYTKLIPPSLAQVSKQTRIEVLPIFYGENAFCLRLNIDVIGYDEYGTPIGQHDDKALDRFIRMCSCMVDTGGLRYIKNLALNYIEPFHERWQFEICLISSGNNEARYPDRIGDDSLDWNDQQAVTAAVTATLNRNADVDLEKFHFHVPVSDIIRVLFTLAKHCHRANQYVGLWCNEYDYEAYD